MKMLVFNFLVTVFSGFILRLNIVVGIPGVTHKFLLESHSHFAFYGWLAQCIYVFVWRHLKQKTGRELNVFRWILTLNLVASYGMLFTFFGYGYYWLSIVFSSIALFNGIFYGVTLFKNTSQCTGLETIWLRAGAIFAAVSSFGIGGIAYTSHKPELEMIFRAATYFYLHFQYNGFFIFSAIGIFFTVLKNTSRQYFPINTTLFLLLFVSSVVTYGLSLLWMDLGSMLLNALKIAGIIQFAGSVLLVLLLRKRCINSLKYTLPAPLFLWIFTGAFILKFFLQMIAPFEPFRIFAAQDRASIIAFLHLVLLTCLSVFFLWMILKELGISGELKRPANIVAGGIVLNQIMLGADVAVNYFQVTIPKTKETELMISIVIFISFGMLMYKAVKRKPQPMNLS